MQKFSEKLIVWYNQNKRDLPWRNTTNAYYIWLSEIILQQTRVDQGLPYYLKFIESFPLIQDLANASQDDVLRLWQGLGYYSRGRNLHFTAKHVVDDLNGIFPTNYDDLIKLKGVGTYTASAIASFCANESTAVVDGNVYRVLSRYFGIEKDVSLTSTQKEIQQLANDVLHKKKPGLHNQAIMEFGALQCVPKNPKCTRCPLMQSCYAFEKKKIESLPFKSAKVKVRKRYFHYLVIHKKNKTYVKRRPAGDIWEGLYEFPLLEFEKEVEENEVIHSQAFKTLLHKSNYEINAISKQFKHQLSHQTILCRFYEIKVQKFALKKDFINVNWLELDKFPKPILIQRFYAKSGV